MISCEPVVFSNNVALDQVFDEDSVTSPHVVDIKVVNGAHDSACNGD
jgi:hypothetical protein